MRRPAIAVAPIMAPPSESTAIIIDWPFRRFPYRSILSIIPPFYRYFEIKKWPPQSCLCKSHRRLLVRERDKACPVPVIDRRPVGGHDNRTAPDGRCCVQGGRVPRH